MADNQNQQLNTDQIRDLLSPYLDNEVTDAERALVEQALADSVELRRELESLRRTVALIAALPPVAAPRPFTLTEADVKPATPAPKGFFGWPVWVRSMAGLAVALVCIVAAASVYLTTQSNVANQAAEIAAVSTAQQPVEAPAAAAPAAREEAAPAESATEEAMAEAAQGQLAPATPTAVATLADALTEQPPANESLELMTAPSDESPAAEGQAVTTEAEQSASADQATAAEEPAPALALTATPSPAPTSLTYAAPAEAPPQENAAGAAADTSQKATESTPAPEAATLAQEENDGLAAESAAPAAPETGEIEPATPTATATATITPQPSATPIALLTLPAPTTPPAPPPTDSDNFRADSENRWLGPGLVVIGVVIIAGLVIWLVRKNKNRAP